jgi:hypothetical protein
MSRTGATECAATNKRCEGVLLQGLKPAFFYGICGTAEAVP